MAMLIERVESSQAFRVLYALLVEYEHDLPPELRHGMEPDFEYAKRTYTGNNAAFLARFDGGYGGCVAVTMLDAQTAILQRLYVQPSRRGAGAARALVQTAITFAREHGCERIVLDTEAEILSAAAALYRSLGFRECGPYGPVDYERPTFMELVLR